MKIDDKKIEDLAQLARLEFNDKEKAQIKEDLGRILDFCDQLNEVDTEGVEPLVYMSDSENVTREDRAVNTISKEEALRNAPSKDSDYFKVPKVINKK